VNNLITLKLLKAGLKNNNRKKKDMSENQDEMENNPEIQNLRQ
jgi:hypothetical protein